MNINNDIQLQIEQRLVAKKREVGDDYFFDDIVSSYFRSIWKLCLHTPQDLTEAQERYDESILSWLKIYVGNDFNDLALLDYIKNNFSTPFTDSQLVDLHTLTFEEIIGKVINADVDDPSVDAVAKIWQKWKPKVINLTPNLVSSIKIVYEEYIMWLKKHPDVIESMAWEAFEKLIAEIFTSKGFHVDLTGRVKNRSADIIALRTDEFGIETKYLIECKRYSKNLRVGLDIVNGVIGAAKRAHVDHAFLITSSFFTSNVSNRTQELKELRLHLRDGADVREWLSDYNVKSGQGIWLSSGWDMNERGHR